MENYVDPNSFASNPGEVCLSEHKFAQLRDDILHLSFLKKLYYNKQFRRINQYLLNGDTQPAIVVSVNPLIISAYSDEMDAVVFLRFPEKLADIYHLSTGMRLVTSNIYFEGDKIAKDIQTGDEYLNQYSDYTPIVQLFLCDAENGILNRTALFDEQIWYKVMRMTEQKASENPKPRDGFYYLTKFSLLFLIF
ncbi:MAG: hypothetical protein K2H89_07000 [Oscillospiraceae bacterium]|nr:hypothetical protein [Oscillospiraceae bacterium]